MAYDQLDPIGKWRDDYRTGLLISKITNIVQKLYPAKNAKPKPTTPDDFMPRWGLPPKRPKKMSQKELKDGIMFWVQMHNESLKNAAENKEK